MDSNLPRLQLELYKEIKKVREDVCTHSHMHTHTFPPCWAKKRKKNAHFYTVYTGLSHLEKKMLYTECSPDVLL